MRKHCHRSCTAAAISTPTPSGASLRKATQKQHSRSHGPSLGSRWSPPPLQNFPSSHHTFSAKTPSSVRTRIASSAFLHQPQTKLPKCHSCKKYKKVEQVIAHISLPRDKHSLAWTNSDLECYHLVIDGGAPGSAPLVPPSKPISDPRPWKCLTINMNHLHVFDSCIDKGLIYHTPRGEHTPFIKVPRKTALIMTDMTNVNVSINLVNALDLACHFQKGKHPCGKTKVTHSQSKLCCIGTKVNRTSTGVSSHSHHIKKMPSSAWSIWDFCVIPFCL